MRTRTEDLLPDLRILALAAVATGLALWLALSAVRLSGADTPGAAPRIAPTLDSPSAAPLVPETAPARGTPATTLSPVEAPPRPAPTEAPTVAPARSQAPASPAPTAPGKVEPFPGNTLDMPIDPPLGAAPWGPPLP